jgi:predicted transcriptional regulator
MVDDELPQDVKRFILERIDSVELLDVLLLLRSDESKPWSADTGSAELRANPASVARRLAYLENLGLIEEDGQKIGSYRYAPKTLSDRELLDQLAEVYKIRRTTVLRLIFSPVRKAIDLASAFNLKRSGDDDG